MKADDDQNPWTNSPYKWLRELPTARRGKAGVALAETMMRGAGYTVKERTAGGHDWTVNGHTVRVKFSTLWATGDYTFQQLPTKDFDVLIMLGVSPTNVHAWAASRDQVNSHLVSDKSLGLEVHPGAAPEWLSGGALTNFFATIPQLLGSPDEPHGPASVTKHAKQ